MPELQISVRDLFSDRATESRALTSLPTGSSQSLRCCLQALQRGRYAFHRYVEPRKAFAGPGKFFPTYKKKPYRPALSAEDYASPGENRLRILEAVHALVICSCSGCCVPWTEWVESEYRIMYKEPWYKGANTKPRVPAWCDRILYRSAEGLQGGVRPAVLVLPDGSTTDDYQAVNSCMRCSDHSPIHTTLLLTTEPNPTPPRETRAYGCRISLQNMRLCDATGRWTLSPDGEWKDAIDSASDTRPAHVLAPYAPHDPLAASCAALTSSMSCRSALLCAVLPSRLTAKFRASIR